MENLEECMKNTFRIIVNFFFCEVVSVGTKQMQTGLIQLL